MEAQLGGFSGGGGFDVGTGEGNSGFDWASLFKSLGDMGTSPGGDIGQIIQQIMQTSRAPRQEGSLPGMGSGATATPGATIGGAGDPKQGAVIPESASSMGSGSTSTPFPPQVMQYIMQIMSQHGGR